MLKTKKKQNYRKNIIKNFTEKLRNLNIKLNNNNKFDFLRALSEIKCNYTQNRIKIII